MPLNSVLEIIELRGAPPADGEPITVGGRSVPAVKLSRFFGHEPTARDVRYGIIAGLAEHRLCVIVDQLIEELDVVVKPLSRIIKSPGIAGATEMGEKGTLLVLDVTGILEQVMKERKAGAPAARTA